jgi:hypothetical protein
VWNTKSINDKVKIYPWLIAKDGLLGCKFCRDAPIPDMDKKSGCAPSKEWTSLKVGFTHDDPRKKDTKLTMLRKKIRLHINSKAHKSSAIVYERKKTLSLTQEKLADQYAKHQSTTEKVFRVAYNIAKMDRPFTDLPQHIDCHRVNNFDVGHVLHTDKSCAAIIKSIASDMRSKLVTTILDAETKISVLVDESTTVSNLSSLALHLRACISDKPTTFFLDLVHLTATDANAIVQAILKTLSGHGFSKEYLQKHFICFASDGASVMTGVKNGVGSLLLEMFPELIIWHCANHRLELAVHDAVNEVGGTNSFKIFIDSLYALYNQSPKLQQELSECASNLELEIKKIAKVLDTRWCASSLRSVKAVWSSFSSLAEHFKVKSKSRGAGNDAAKFTGMLHSLTSKHFLSNLAIMYDALEEIAHLSSVLQNRDISVVTAHKLFIQTIKAVEHMCTNPGPRQLEALDAIELGEFKGVELCAGRVVPIHSGQFYRSLANSLSARLLTVKSRKGENLQAANKHSAEYTSLLQQISVLDCSTWPLDYESLPNFGENDIRSLCTRFRIDSTECVRDFKLFKAAGKRASPSLQNLKLMVQSIPVSTADCERAFSLMNTILSPKRNRLQIENASCLMFLSVMGPPIHTFNPTPYVKNWLRRGCHSASDTQSIKRALPDVTQECYAHVYEVLSK